jgi:hypothetical protein
MISWKAFRGYTQCIMFHHSFFLPPSSFLPNQSKISNSSTFSTRERLDLLVNHFTTKTFLSKFMKVCRIKPTLFGRKSVYLSEVNYSSLKQRGLVTTEKSGAIPVSKSSPTTTDIFQLKILANCQRINANWYTIGTLAEALLILALSLIFKADT